MKNTLVVNLLGSPGTGKSTMAARIFSELKFQGIDAELVSEFAKELVWEERNQTFKDEVYLFAKQNHRLFRVNGKVDVLVTDRPVILSMVYSRLYGTGSKAFDELIMEETNRYRNMNILLNRTKKYNPNGRNQTEEESNTIADKIKEILFERNVNFIEVPAQQDQVDLIVEMIKKEIS